MYDPLGNKRLENIAAYIISMWHIEDLMRAHQLDIDSVDALMLEDLDVDDDTREQIRAWYESVIEAMLDQGLKERGHLADLVEVMAELEYLHSSLLETFNDPEYERLFALAEPGITALQEQAGATATGPIETCFTAIYGVLVLRAREQEISASTAEAEGHMRRLLEHLSQHYRRIRRLPGVSMN
jgi:hypothetical protein